MLYDTSLVSVLFYVDLLFVYSELCRSEFGIARNNETESKFYLARFRGRRSIRRSRDDQLEKSARYLKSNARDERRRNKSCPVARNMVDLILERARLVHGHSSYFRRPTALNDESVYEVRRNLGFPVSPETRASRRLHETAKRFAHIARKSSGFEWR